MRLLTLALLMALPIGLPATTLIVDGPGDGDTSGIDDFDSIREALMDLGDSGLGTDGASDEIHVVVDTLTEDYGFMVNGSNSTAVIPNGPISGEAYAPVRDDLIINGDADDNGVWCVVDLTDNNWVRWPWVYPEPRYNFGYRITLDMAAHQDVVLRECILILTAGSHTLCGMMEVDEANDATLTLEKVMITATLGDNSPVPPDALFAGGTAARTNQGTAVIDTRITSEENRMEYRFVNFTLAHQQAPGVHIKINSGRIIFENSWITRNGYLHYLPGESWGNGIRIEPMREVRVTLDHTRVDHDVFHGLTMSPPISSDYTMRVAVGKGCEFSDNGMRGVAGGVLCDLTYEGTENEPILIQRNRNSGASALLYTESQPLLRNVIATHNGEHGILLALGNPGLVGSVEHCLIADNYQDYDPDNWHFFGLYQVMADTETAEPVTVEFTDCTIHNVDYEFVTDARPVSEVVLPPLGSDDLRLVLTDTIISGSPDEFAFYTPSTSTATAIASPAVIALEGPDRVGDLRSGSGATLILDNALFVDPMYVQTDDPDAPGYFDVQNPVLRNAASDGGPLSGWGNYTGPTGEESGLLWQ